MRLLIIGATGLVGRELVEQAAAHPQVTTVVALVRRDPGARPSPKVLYRVVDFDQLEHLEDAFAVDAVLSALGTTAKATPDPVRYHRVEVGIPLDVATRARAAGARRFGLVSSVGAATGARTTYLRQKAELEDGLRALGWERLVIARPSFLAGAREEFRLGERLGMLVARLFPAAYRPVAAGQVARGLLAAVLREGPAVEVLDNATLRAL